MEQWNGFSIEWFKFEEHDAAIVFPKTADAKKRVALKTEYFGAFPNAEVALLEKGFHLIFIKNDNRWGTDADIERKARFQKFVSEKYGLSEKCVPVGMSCGGLYGIKYAAKHPELVSCLYLDAPVVNYMSCPCGFGIGNPISIEEILGALSLDSISDLLNYREMPFDYLPALVKTKIPIILVVGDSDQTVPYVENGINIKNAYEKAGNDIEVHIKPGCDHHPHGLSDPAPIVDFILKHS